MLDFSRLTDFLTGMAAQAFQDATSTPQGLAELLADAGLDPSTLAGLSEGELIALLNDHGIDPTQFAPEELANYVSSLGNGASLLQGFVEENRQG